MKRHVLVHYVLPFAAIALLLALIVIAGRALTAPKDTFSAVVTTTSSTCKVVHGLSVKQAEDGEVEFTFMTPSRGVFDIRWGDFNSSGDGSMVAALTTVAHRYDPGDYVAAMFVRDDINGCETLYSVQIHVP